MWTFLQRFRSSSKAFTIIELLMVIGIITILTAVFLIQQRQFDSSTLLRSLAYKVALAVREAQTYGSSVRFTGTTPATAYGIYIANGSPITQYHIFADANSNRQYDSGESIETFSLNNSFTVNKFCAKPVSGAEVCSPSGITSLTIVYVRPNTDACFATSAAPLTCQTGSLQTDYASSSIQVKSPKGVTRSIMMTSTGQISVGEPGT